jgi:endo-1,4-beta-D-glucanase Y
MKFKIIFILIFLVIISCHKGDSLINNSIISNHPFPSRTNYIGNYIKPNNYSQTELDNHTKMFYEEWKNKYLTNDCNSSQYYIEYDVGKKTVSEAHGYGMMIMCFMAGYENNAKQYFDGLFNYYKSHPSFNNNNLMDWQQITCNDTPDSNEDDSASDGDIDIAFSLLLAHNQWGSNGTINYLVEAKNIINAIMMDEINQSTWTVKLGDWSTPSEPNFYFGTRTSDFIISHFKIFSIATSNINWNTVVDKCYTLINENQNTTTGLVPDFIINTNTTSSPANPNYLEDIYDGDYYYNACRFPWRIGTDFLISGDNRAKIALNKLNSWLLNSTSGTVDNISNGYLLNGTAIYNWNDATFIGPLTVGAMADVNNQTWLNNLYEDLLTNNDLSDGDYYSNTLKLLSLITISGNYWNPDI